MEKEITTKKMIRKLIALITSIVILVILMTLDILKIEVINSKYILTTIILSCVISLGAILFKYYYLTKSFKYYYYQIIDFFFMLNVALVFIHIFFIFIFFPATVYKSSMYPTLKERDHLLVESVMGFEDVERFEIVVLKVDENINDLYSGVLSDELIVKRVIAYGGDTFYFNEDGILYLNGKEINETYIKDSFGNFITDGIIYNAKTRPFRLEDTCKIKGENVCKPGEECKVPEDYFFVLGDNRNSSIDSRHLGLFHKSQVIGVAKYRQVTIFKWEKI